MSIVNDLWEFLAVAFLVFSTKLIPYTPWICYENLEFAIWFIIINQNRKNLLRFFPVFWLSNHFYPAETQRRFYVVTSYGRYVKTTSYSRWVNKTTVFIAVIPDSSGKRTTYHTLLSENFSSRLYYVRKLSYFSPRSHSKTLNYQSIYEIICDIGSLPRRYRYSGNYRNQS